MKALLTSVFVMLATSAFAEGRQWTKEAKDREFERSEYNCIWLMKEINFNLEDVLSRASETIVRYNTGQLLLVEKYAGIWHDFCKTDKGKRYYPKPMIK